MAGLFYSSLAVGQLKVITDEMAKEYLKVMGRQNEAVEVYKSMMNYQIMVLKKRPGNAKAVLAAEALLKPDTMNKHVSLMNADLVKVVKNSYSPEQLAQILTFFKSEPGRAFQVGDIKVKFSMQSVLTSRLKVIFGKEIGPEIKK